MKYLMLFPVLLVSILTGCETQRCKPVGTVINRDAHGRFIKPVCPECGNPPIEQCTMYRDANHHVFATEFQ